MVTLPTGPDFGKIPTDRGLCPPPTSADASRWQASFEHLGRVYTAACVRYVFGLMRPHASATRALEVAQDVTQSFFARAMETASLAARGREIRSFGKWMRKQLRDHWVDVVRHEMAQRNQPANGFASEDVLQYQIAPDNLRAADNDFEEGVICVAVQRAISRLESGEGSRKHGARHAAIIRDLIVSEGDVGFDLAKRLGVPDASLARHKHQARQKLRALLRDEIERVVGDREEFEELWARVEESLPLHGRD